LIKVFLFFGGFLSGTLVTYAFFSLVPILQALANLQL
tara:strand:- start:186 stop:296 length:111 start_codon:yes stop_codon:yes gene_type:complete